MLKFPVAEMGILRSREELLPVTCAILSEADRDDFFARLKKRVGGRIERIASACEVPPSAVSDWISGKFNIPYHALQRMSQEFEVEAPAVSELRREYQPVQSVAPPKRREPLPAPAKENIPIIEREERPRRERGRKGRAQKGQPKQPRQKAPRQERKPKAEKKPRQQQPPREARPQAGGKPGAPKLSDKLAYWSAVLLTAGRREEDCVVLSADRRIGQNFAGVWANLTQDLFGIRPALESKEEGKVQQARLPSAGLEEFLARIEFKAGVPTAEAPGAPRWAWSNPQWQTAFLKGIVDASAQFHRAPSLTLSGLSPRLAKSAQKMFSALKLEPAAGEGTLTLEGDAVLRYFEAVGTQNMKLRDQLKAHLRHRAGGPLEEVPEEGPAPEASASDAPSAEAVPTEPAVNGEAPAASAGAAPKPRRRRGGRGRRTVFVGRPKA